MTDSRFRRWPFVAALAGTATLALTLCLCRSDDSGGALAPGAGEGAQPTAVEYGFTLALEPVVDVGDQITFLTHAGDGSGRLFVVSRAGVVRVLRGGALDAEPFLDASGAQGSALPAGPRGSASLVTG